MSSKLNLITVAALAALPVAPAAASRRHKNLTNLVVGRDFPNVKLKRDRIIFGRGK